MGTGCAKGQGRARAAAEMAVTSPLLDNISVDGATGVLINIVGGPDLKMREIQEAASLVQEQAHEEANIIFGASIDETLGDMVKVTVIATGFELDAELGHVPPARAAQPVATSPGALASRGGAPSFAAGPASRPAQGQGHGPAEPSGPGPAYVRRPAAPPPTAREAGRTHIPPVFDADWDVPAFQRRGNQ
ncbi:MAG TPA: cell division protein FtsZ, partial [Polyangiaceae bacterium]|nr:cell division protein FtsZ [Polyangiaceae bacterium]